jgi:hypothetical protein
VTWQYCALSFLVGYFVTMQAMLWAHGAVLPAKVAAPKLCERDRWGWGYYVRERGQHLPTDMLVEVVSDEHELVLGYR